MKITIIVSMLLGLGCFGCSSSAEITYLSTVETSPRGAPLVVSPGIDSVVAMWAQQQAQDTSFVTIEEEEQAAAYKQEGIRLATAADSLWRIFKINPDSAYHVSREDSIKAIKRFNEGARTLNAYAQLDSTQVEEARALLARAQQQLEAALVSNPSDSSTRQWLARVYYDQGRWFSQEGRYLACIDMLERLTYLRRGEHIYLRDLGECQYAAMQWSAMLETFRKAEEVLLDATYEGLAAQDSAHLFLYVYRQAEAHTRRYDADAAINHFKRAKQLARTSQNQAVAQSYIDWILWDEGNIKNVMARDSLREVAPDDPKGAARGYEALLAAVTKKQAKHEVAWRLALVENMLGQFEQAVRRLREVIIETPTQPEDLPTFEIGDALRLVQALAGDDFAVQVAAAETLNAADPEVVDGLLPVLRRPDGVSAQRLAERLEQTGTSRPEVARAVRGLGNEAPAARLRAADALCLATHSLPLDQLYYVPGKNLRITLYGVPQDPAYGRYFEDYATLLFNLGQSYLDTDRQKALVHFMQASTVPSLIRTDAFYEIAQLLRNNTRSALSFTWLALRDFTRLTPQQRAHLQLDTNRQQELYFALSQHFRNLGAFDCGRSYYEHAQAF